MNNSDNIYVIYWRFMKRVFNYWKRVFPSYNTNDQMTKMTLKPEKVKKSLKSYSFVF